MVDSTGEGDDDMDSARRDSVRYSGPNRTPAEEVRNQMNDRNENKFWVTAPLGSGGLLIPTKTAFPAGVLAFFCDGRAADSQTVREKPRTTAAGVGDGHQRLGGPNGGRRVQLSRFLSGALVENLDHSIFFYNLRVEILNPASERRRRR